MTNFTAVVEMPLGTKYKYEINKNGDTLKIDRVLSISAPCNYGFLPNTLSQDGDNLDVFILSDEAIPPKTYTNISFLAAFECTDRGEEDNKIIACLQGEERRYKTEEGFTLLFESMLAEIENYLLSYKKGFKVKSFHSDPSEVLKLYNQANNRQWLTNEDLSYGN